MTESLKGFLEKLVTGGVSGIIGTTAIFPVDLIKTRLQNSDARVKSNGFGMFSKILRQEGPRGLYRGLLANLVGVTPEKAIKLAANDFFRHRLSKIGGMKNPDKLPVHLGMLAGALAGLAQVVATNPMETVKIQMQIATSGLRSVLDREVSKIATIRNYSTLAVVKELGIRGLYRGSSATLSRDIPFSMLFFQLFATFKDLQNTGSQELGFTRIFGSGIAAGAVSAFLVTPMDVVKTRLQSGRSNVGLIQTYRNIFRNEGLGAFFKGSLHRCLIVAPLFGISLTAYEFQQQFLNKRNGVVS